MTSRKLSTQFIDPESDANLFKTRLDCTKRVSDTVFNELATLEGWKSRRKSLDNRGLMALCTGDAMKSTLI